MMTSKNKLVRYFQSEKPESIEADKVVKPDLKKPFKKIFKKPARNKPREDQEHNGEEPKKLPNPYNLKKIKTGVHRKRFEDKGEKINYLKTIREGIKELLTEHSGFLEADAGETTTQFRQREIAKSVDITAAAKQFELQLRDFGPYQCRYTRNGRHLLLGGKRGHMAAMDWVTKKLHCELNVMESIHDVSWLHLETMFAVAQKKWVYIYDNQGIELHCVKKLHNVNRLEFLPYHFLLAAGSSLGYLSWLDVSIGKLVAQFNTNLGRLQHLVQNPYNAVLCVGHAKGVVSMWTPNSRQPVAKMLCHKAPINALHIDPSGLYMATAGAERALKIWDIRKLSGPLQSYTLNAVPSSIEFSQEKLLAVAMGNIVEVYKDCINTTDRPYMRHRFNTPISQLAFCPYEDVLGVGTETGFASLLIPGAGEANFDTYEANPFQTKSQRREREVKQLLEKIQPELITLDPNMIGQINVQALEERLENRKKYLKAKGQRPFVKHKKIVPHKKRKRRGNSSKDDDPLKMIMD